MLTNEDILKIAEIVATKEDVRDLKQDVEGLRESVQTLTISVDRLVKAVEDMHQEYISVLAKVDRHEKWMHQIAEKLGIKLEY